MRPTFAFMPDWIARFKRQFASVKPNAPDLLEALEWLLSSYKAYQDDPDSTDWPEAQMHAEWAIAKSRGRV